MANYFRTDEKVLEGSLHCVQLPIPIYDKKVPYLLIKIIGEKVLTLIPNNQDFKPQKF